MAECKQVCQMCQGRYCQTKVSIFEILDEAQLAEVTDIMTRRNFKKGDVLFFEGDVSDKLFLVNRGKLKIYKYTKEGKEQILYILSEGDFIGDMNLLKKDTFKFNAVALEDSNICVLTKDDFDHLLKKHPDIGLKIMQVIYDRVMNLEGLVQRLGTKDIESRLAGLLLSLIKDFGTPKEKIVVLDIPLSREDMANYIGSTRETVSRKLSGMQDEGIIELKGNKTIIINNLEALEDLA